VNGVRGEATGTGSSTLRLSRLPRTETKAGPEEDDDADRADENDDVVGGGSVVDDDDGMVDDEVEGSCGILRE